MSPITHLVVEFYPSLLTLNRIHGGILQNQSGMLPICKYETQEKAGLTMAIYVCQNIGEYGTYGIF